MQDYQKLYREKLTSPQEAVKIVEDGMWLDYGHAMSVPKLLDRALAERVDDLQEVFVRGYLIFHPIEILKANQTKEKPVFIWNSWFTQAQDRKLMPTGATFFIPMRFAELPEMYRREEDIAQVDVLMVQAAPMDANGNFNLGPCIAATREAANRAKYIIIEENKNMPVVYGLSDDVINISEVYAVVKSEEAMDTIPSAAPDEIDKKIASLVMEEIHDGATLQLGIGGMPNAVGYQIAQSDLKDLGIHSEMYVDSMMAMSKAGIITGHRKNLNRGKQVFSFAMGSQELYDWMDHNQALASAPVDYVNDPFVVAQIDNFISINNCVNIDLFGQINAESAGSKHISGTGGQLDFVLGAYASKGGKSIIAISAARKKKDGSLESRILPTLQEGSIVTDPRSTAHYVATEYGMVNLKGKSTWQRAEALISIAHPDVREDLIKEAEKLHIWRRSNK